MIGTLQGFNEDVNKNMVVLRETKLDQVRFSEFHCKHLQEMREMKNRVEDIHNCMRSTDNYLEKYQPFNAFC
jgi:hypothetical protein